MEINYNIHKNPPPEISIWILSAHLSSSAVQQPNLGTGHTSLVRFLDISLSLSLSHTHTHTHTHIRTALDERSARLRGCYLHNTSQTRETNAHAILGIPTHGTSNQGASDVQLQSPGSASSGFLRETTAYIFLISPMHTTCSGHFTILDFIKIMWWTINIQKFFQKQQAHMKCC